MDTTVLLAEHKIEKNATNEIMENAVNNTDKDENIGTVDEIQIARNIYNTLSLEAKEIFEQSLIYDSQLLEFHQTYVNPNFELLLDNNDLKITYSAVSDPIAILTAQLTILNLPSAVLYS